MRTPTRSVLVLCLTVVASLTGACGGADTGTPGAVSAPPSSRGDIWEIQSPSERAMVSGSIVAFVNGVHVMVVDGDRVFAGMTELATKAGTNGGQTITFPSGLSADLVPSAQGAELRFSSGERVLVHERQ
ncbi:MAG TPA: hypothetical protein VFB85_10690 [Vicinamibacterales bacterium]|jgi:hypothetical protein|nr:hypothetical protein [Vicinamibacterales bacterium]